MYSNTTALKKVLEMKSRLRVVQGGARAGKTIAILLILIDIAQSQDKKIISVVSETFPHLKRGAMRDFLDIMNEQRYFKEGQWNKTDSIYTFETGSIIEFFSADQPSKVRGPARHILFLNEANNIIYETYTQLAIRTSEYIYVDYNPTAEFWIHEEIIPHQKHDFLILTYKDNEELSPEIVAELESRRGNKNFWLVYGQGLLGEAEGRIYTGWKLIDSIPHEARLERRGLDFGFSNDPASIIDVYFYNGGYILSERLYRKGMLNNDTAAYLQNLESPNTLIMADSAEPKSVAELQAYNLPIVGVIKKGFGNKSYLKASIDYMQQQRISVTKNSTNLIKEYRNYLWMTDKDGRLINEPEPGRDHALDAARYAFDGLRPQEIEDDKATSGKVTSLWA